MRRMKRASGGADTEGGRPRAWSVLTKLTATAAAVCVMLSSGFSIPQSAYAAGEELSVTWAPIGSTETTVGATFNGVATVSCSSVESSGGCENPQLRIIFDPDYPADAYATNVSTWPVFAEASASDAAWLPRTAARVEGDAFVWDLAQPIPVGKTVAINVSFTSPLNYTPVDSFAVFSATVRSSNAPDADASDVAWHITGAGAVTVFGGAPKATVIGTPVATQWTTAVSGVASSSGDVTCTTEVPAGIELQDPDSYPNSTWDPAARTLTAVNLWEALRSPGLPISLVFDTPNAGTFSISTTCSYLPIGATTPVTSSVPNTITVAAGIDAGSVMRKRTFRSNASTMTTSNWVALENQDQDGIWRLLVDAQPVELTDLVIRDPTPCKTPLGNAVSDFTALCQDVGTVVHGVSYVTANTGSNIPNVSVTFRFTDGTTETLPLPVAPDYSDQHAVRPTDPSKVTAEVEWTIDRVPSTTDGGQRVHLNVFSGIVDGYVAGNTISNEATICGTPISSCDTEVGATAIITSYTRSARVSPTDNTYIRLASNSNVAVSTGTTVGASTFPVDAQSNSAFHAVATFPADLIALGVSSVPGRTVTPDFDGTGSTLVHQAGSRNGTGWSSGFDGISFDASRTAPGVYVVDIYSGFTTGDVNQCTGARDEPYVDMDGILGNPAGVPLTICKGTAYVTVVEPGTSFSLNKESANLTEFGGWVSGGGAAQVDVGDVAGYRVSFLNSTSSTITNAVVYDVFPHVGDTGVMLTGQERGSEFTPTLDAAPTIASQSAWTIAYTTAANPCRPEVLPSNPGCVDDWSTTPPADLATVTGVRYTCPSVPSMAGMSSILRFNVPADTVAGYTAWNSVAATGGSASGPIAPAESPKAGVRLPPPVFSIQIEKIGESTEAAWVRVDGSAFEILSDDAGQPGSPLTAPTPTEAGVGLFDVTDIQAGTYWLRETQAPDGFLLLAQAVQFTVNADGTITIGTNGGDVVTADGGLITVRDVPAFTMPATGGTGSLPFAFVGLALVALALVLTSVRRRERGRAESTEIDSTGAFQRS